ncbi:MAG: MFS transporter [Acidobacteria bacterium]|nr:MFS transporter [Acidobacteriota bacterium]
MIALAFLATMINYLDRQTLSVAAPILRAEFHMSNEAYSRIVSAFLFAYTIMNGLSGPLIDRLGTRIGYGLCVLWWSLAAALHAVARGPLSLGAFRFLLGIGEAGNWPGAVKVVAEWFPERERAMASGIFNSGSAVGAIIAPPLVAFLIEAFGWRFAFGCVGLVGLLWLAAWFAIYRTPAVSSEGARDAGDEPTVPVARLLRMRFVQAFTVSKIFMDPVWYFYIFWFPEYLNATRHFNLAAIGRFAWIPFAVAGLGNLLGGWLSGALLARGLSVTVARKTAVTIFAALMTSAIPAVLAPQAWQAIALVSVAMLGYTGCLANMLSFPADVFPRSTVASVYGLASMGSGFGGMIFTLVTGWAVDHYSYTPVFIGFGILPLICATILWLWLGPLEKMNLERNHA